MELGRGSELLKASSLQNIHDKIEALWATEDEFFTAGADGKLKRWVDIEGGGYNSDEVSLGTRINAICMGRDKDIVYAADASGLVQRITFD